MASTFPNLPGFIPTQNIDKKNFHRVSSQQQEKNKDVKNKKLIKYPLPDEEEPVEIDQNTAFNKKYLSSSHSVHQPLDGKEITEQFQPAWVKLAQHVLRFFGFFKEGAVETPLETYRIRQLIIYFYLEDDTISIIEKKQMNSGIPQGEFFKRKKVLKEDGSGEFFSIYDFKIGQEISFFGKKILLHGCDEYTRKFFEKLGMTQDPDFEANEDEFQKKTLTKFVPQKDHMMKNYLEHKLGGGRPAPQKQFLENDRKVLKFYVYGEKPYILHYYLADDTIEIREVHFQNDGFDPFALFLKRGKLKKNFALSQPGQQYEQEYIKPLDIRFGEFLNIYGKNFIINGCDKFTHDYYKENYNKDFPIGEVQEPQPRPKKDIYIPPYNGFGDEQDSLGYVYRLVPIPPKKDYFKWVDNQVILRFTAKLNTDAPEDINRLFIITYYLNDDSLQVYEPVQRNSGFVNGKFLEKKQYKNVANNYQFFKHSDLIIGKDVKINGFSFHLIDADEFTKSWQKNNLAE